MISLKKKTAEWWDAFSKDKSYKRFIKTDFSKWCEEEDREYMGDFGPADDMGGMGGMGGMDFGAPPHASNRGGELGRPSPVARAPQLSVAATAARASRCAFARRWNGHGRHGHGWHGRHGQLWRQRRRAAAVMKKSAPGRVAPAPPACRGELALMRGPWHLWLLATACYSCRTQEDEGDLGDLGPSDLPPLEDDGPPPLESSGNGDEGPPALEPDISQMKEVD